MNADRLRSIMALTAVLRTHDLGLDARTALRLTQVRAVAAWRRREEHFGLSAARADAVRRARRVLGLDDELKRNREQVTTLVSDHATVLLQMTGVGAAPAVVVAVWSSWIASGPKRGPARSRRPRATPPGTGWIVAGISN